MSHFNTSTGFADAALRYCGFRIPTFLRLYRRCFRLPYARRVFHNLAPEGDRNQSPNVEYARSQPDARYFHQGSLPEPIVRSVRCITCVHGYCRFSTGWTGREEFANPLCELLHIMLVQFITPDCFALSAQFSDIAVRQTFLFRFLQSLFFDKQPPAFRIASARGSISRPQPTASNFSSLSASKLHCRKEERQDDPDRRRSDTTLPSFHRARSKLLSRDFHRILRKWIRGTK